MVHFQSHSIPVSAGSLEVAQSVVSGKSVSGLRVSSNCTTCLRSAKVKVKKIKVCALRNVRELKKKLI